MSTARLTACLARIANRLNAEGITWALGASLMLHYRGLVDAPHDVDLLVAETDAMQADAVLRTLGSREADRGRGGVFETGFFHEYRVDGVEVDLMAGLVIRYEEERYAFTLNPAHFEVIEVAGERVYLSAMEDWYVLYQLMPERAQRVAQVEAYLRTHSARPEVVRGWLDAPLPDAIQARLAALPLRTS